MTPFCSSFVPFLTDNRILCMVQKPIKTAIQTYASGLTTHIKIWIDDVMPNHIY